MSYEIRIDVLIGVYVRIPLRSINFVDLEVSEVISGNFL